MLFRSIRWLLERYEFPFEVVYPATLNRGGLAARFDVLIFADDMVPARESAGDGMPADLPAEYRGRSGTITLAASEPQLKRFVEDGGVWSSAGVTSGMDLALAMVEQETMDRRVDLAIAKLEVEALAKSFGLTRKTRFINVLDAGGISKTQKDTGEPSADGGGFVVEFAIPLYDFGRARTREAEQRYLEAVNLLGEKAINARSQAREAYSAYHAAYDIALQDQNHVRQLREIGRAHV